MKIGVIGLGDIAQKAYLPVIGDKGDIELVFATRNQEKLNYLANKYSIKETARSVEELISKNVKAVFVHAATVVHKKIVKELLLNDIHVYVDKPITNSYQQSKELVNLAQKRGLKLLVGFNRRRAPMYQKLKKVNGPTIINFQKNRFNNPRQVREVIFDDFIHVVDTLRFLADNQVKEFAVEAVVDDGLLYQVMLTLTGVDFKAIGIMNRDSGINEELAEVIGSKQKLIVKGMTELIKYQNGEEKRSKVPSWDSTLYNRGFVQLIDEFLEIVKEGQDTTQLAKDALATHELCENIVQEIKN
ncbi:putative dehydrogenase [Halobacteroides halobius DSM 5150]|uniref:Putative dehydrogenase n=1 Tax=Halobacteroides halobius (strain ATCC 35273 / DSM 5150 / MD-1) TaxID=748449 RepID=L0KBT7_HALHC|nr:Gfo/Idh/MocA family oxidoreductase [Halobacteroides halobius]AGB41553.1 putative dehydrogenase [Halobacteroides halobius DSM 5150]